MQDTSVINELLRLNSYYSSNRATLEPFPVCFKDLCTILFQHCQSFIYPPFVADKTLEVKYDYEHTGEEKEIVLCFSGGRKSIALALFYKNLGYKITLYNIMDKDTDQAMKYAKRMELPMIVDIFKGQPKNVPLKYVYIATRALDYIDASGRPHNLALGCFSSSSLTLDKFDKHGCGTMEMFEALQKAVSPYYPDLKIRRPIPNLDYMYQIFISHPSYMRYTTKLDYVVMCDWGKLPEASKSISFKDYYKYLSEVKKSKENDRGFKYKTFYDFWRDTFFYSIEKSKFRKELTEKLTKLPT